MIVVMGGAVRVGVAMVVELLAQVVRGGVRNEQQAVLADYLHLRAVGLR
jgi:hypothetical protein